MEASDSSSGGGSSDESDTSTRSGHVVATDTGDAWIQSRISAGQRSLFCMRCCVGGSLMLLSLAFYVGYYMLSGVRSNTTTGLTVNDEVYVDGTLVATSSDISNILGEGPYTNSYKQECETAGGNGDVFRNYAEFHQRCRQDPACLRRALVWKCEENDICGGLGDEINGLAFTMYTAVVLKRPFFVRWNRSGVKMLDLFQGGAIDVRPPEGLPACPTSTILDSHDPKALFARAAASRRCDTWVTNMNLVWIKADQPDQPIMAALRQIRKMFWVGCAMSFMFQPSGLSQAERDSFAHLPDKFTVIHFRCDDSAMSTIRPKISEAETRIVQESLKCAKKVHNEHVVFVSCSQQAKELAVTTGSSMGLDVITTEARAHHIDHDRKKLNTSQFRASLWSDFVVLQNADTMIRCGSSVLGPGRSGFSGVAASMAFYPTEKLFYCTGDTSVCHTDERAARL